MEQTKAGSTDPGPHTFEWYADNGPVLEDEHTDVADLRSSSPARKTMRKRLRELGVLDLVPTSATRRLPARGALHVGPLLSNVGVRDQPGAPGPRDGRQRVAHACETRRVRMTSSAGWSGRAGWGSNVRCC